MTLSNNAIKFLQAQYRAIFKRAYIKGLAAAVLLTAGLAAGQAQALELSSGANAETDIVTQGSGDTFKVQSPTTVNSIKIQNGHSLTTSGGIFVTGELSANGDLTIEKGSIQLIEKEGDQKDKDVYRYDFTSNGGNLNLAGNIGAASFNISGGTLVLTSGGDGNTNLTAYGEGWVQSEGIVDGIDYDRTTANGNLSHMEEITVNSGTNIAALNRLTIDNVSNITLSGGGSSGGVASGDTAYLEGSCHLDISESTITVSGYANGIFSPDGRITDTKITINDTDDKLLIAGNANDYTTVLSGTADANAATYNLSNVTLTNKGTLQLGTTEADSFTITDGTIKNTGTVDFEGGTLNLDSALVAGLFASGDSSAKGKLNLVNGAMVTVTGDELADLSAVGIADASGSGIHLVASGESTWTQDNVKLGTIFNSANLAFDVKNLTAETAPYTGYANNDNAFFIEQGKISVSNSITLVSGDGYKSGKDDRIYVVASGAGTSATLNLINDGNTSGQLKNVDRLYVGYDKQGTSILNVDGNWDFGGARLAVNTSGTAKLNGTVDNIGILQIDNKGVVNIGSNADVTVGRLLGGQKAIEGNKISIDGTLTIKGDSDIDDKNDKNEDVLDIKLTTAKIEINNGGTLDIKSDAVDNVVNASGDVITANWTSGNVTLNAGGTLSVDLGDITLSQAQLGSLKNGLVNTGYKGSFDFGDSLTIKLEDDSLQTAIDNKGEVSYTQLSGAGINDVKGIADGVTVTVTDDEATKGINLSNGASAVKLASGTTSVTVDGTLMLNSSTGGNFVYSEDSGNQTVAGVTVKSGSGVNLTGAGTVGALVKNGSDTGTSAVLNAGQGATQTIQGKINLDTVTIGQGTVEVADNVTATTLTLDGNLTNAVDTTVSGNTAKSITATSLTQNGGTLVTNNLTLGASGSTSTTSELKGVVTADSITIQQASSTAAGQGNVINIINDSLVATDTFTAASGAVIKVGTDGDGTAGSSSTGTLDVGSLVLNGATLTIDPIYGLDYAATIVNTLSQNNTLDGSVNIGQNSVLAVGFEDRTELDQFLSENKLLGANGSLQAQYGSLLIVNDTMTVAQGYGVALDGTQTPITTAQNEITVDSGAAIVVTEDAFGGRDGNGELNGSYAIKFVNTTGSLDFTGGGKVLLAGAFYADDFAGNDKQIAIAETSAGAAGTVTVTNGTNALESTNGVLKGNVSATGTIQNVTLDRTAFDQDITMASDPIKDLLFTAVEGTHVLDKTALGARFLNNVGNGTSQSHGQDAEAAARLATFGGAIQAGFMAQQTSTDAVAERLGMANPNSALITSSNAQGGGLWIAPVYKNQDSDEFDAQGVDYGADINLYGLALGADFTTESGVRVGALFNLGSGDADGQGVGSTVSNDFDYFGFTLYAGATFGNFALTADAGFTQLSNDLEQSTYMGTLKADTDTTVTSVGLRGEYLFATPMVDIVPHVGLRYTSLDLDSYDVQSEGGLLASTDADSLQVFSIPFGVTFSKDMAMGNWLVKPVFDLTLTANTGDDEIDSTTTFTGMQSVALSTEIMDSFTYGATLGINAQYQESISFGLNVGYTGSSSADEFGVNANARYTF